MIQYVIFGCLGKIVLYLAMIFPKHPRGEFFDKLFGCDLCLGVWIYTGLALLLGIDITKDVFPYVPFFSEFLTGAAFSFFVHLLSIGWTEKFGTIYME